MLNPPANKIWMISVIIVFGYSCNTWSNSANKQDTALLKEDTVGHKADSAIFPKDFIALKKYFSNDSIGEIDSTAEISLALIKSYLKHDLDTSFNRSVNPIRLIENKFGYFFIIRQNCIAGGDCAVFQLLMFDLSGHFVKNQELGMLTADESERIFFRYKILADSILLTYEIKRDEEKDVIVDTIAKRVKLAR